MLSREQNWNIVQAQDLLEEIASSQILITAIYELNACADMITGDDIQYFLGVYRDLEIREKVRTAIQFLEKAKEKPPAP